MAAIETRALRKVYPLPPASKRRGPPPGMPPGMAGPPPSVAAGAEGVVALDALDLAVNEGELFGLLGPNGAGKTTTIGILTTRVLPTGGVARIEGIDVARDPVAVKRRIGVVPQVNNLDRSLTAREILLFHAEYFGVAKPEREENAQRLLERFELGERADE